MVLVRVRVLVLVLVLVRVRAVPEVEVVQQLRGLGKGDSVARRDLSCARMGHTELLPNPTGRRKTVPRARTFF